MTGRNAKQGQEPRDQLGLGRGFTLFFVCLFLAVPLSIWDLSSSTRDQTHTPCSGSAAFFFYYFIYLFLGVLGLCCCMGFSLAVASRGYSLVTV